MERKLTVVVFATADAVTPLMQALCLQHLRRLVSITRALIVVVRTLRDLAALAIDVWSVTVLLELLSLLSDLTLLLSLQELLLSSLEIANFCLQICDALSIVVCVRLRPLLCIRGGASRRQRHFSTLEGNRFEFILVVELALQLFLLLSVFFLPLLKLPLLLGVGQRAADHAFGVNRQVLM